MRFSGSDQSNRHFFGIYRAKVEDVSDPQQSGRIRVRIFGIHSQDPNEVPVNTLPFAIPAMPPIEGSIEGSPAGHFSVPRLNSNIWVFFDAGNHNLPVYFAAAPDKGDWPAEARGNTDLTTIVFKDGQKINIDSNAKTMSYSHPSGATLNIDSAGAIRVTGVQMDFESDGDMNFDAGGDIKMTAAGQHSTNAGTINHN